MKLWIAGLVAAASISVPAAAEVVAMSDAGFVVRISAEVTASSQDTWKELVTPADWWSKAHTFSGDSANLYLDSQATGCFCEKLPAPKGAAKDSEPPQRPGSVEHMQIVYVEPGKVLRMIGALGPLQSEALNGTLTITLKPVNGRTRILWEYVVGGYMRYKAEEIAPAVDKVLAEQLDSLAAKLGPVVPPPATPAKDKGGAAKPAPAKPKVAPKSADDAEVQKPEADETPPVDVPDEPEAEGPKAEEPKPAPVPTTPARPGRRQPKSDDEYVEPTR